MAARSSFDSAPFYGHRMFSWLWRPWHLGWRITARCAFGNNDGMRSNTLVHFTSTIWI
jgi:hypothetical protein